MEILVFFLAKISRNSTELPSDAFPLQAISQSRQSFNHKRCLLACIIIAKKKRQSFSAIATWGKNSCNFFVGVLPNKSFNFHFLVSPFLILFFILDYSVGVALAFRIICLAHGFWLRFLVSSSVCFLT